MTNTEAYELARQWCASNDTGHQPHLQYPWVQDMGRSYAERVERVYRRLSR